MRRIHAFAASALAGLCLGWSAFTWAQQGDDGCLKCHKEYQTVVAGKKPLPIPCSKCHETLDGNASPHANAGKYPLGLGAKGADSCLLCHGKEDYTKTRHGTLGSGCTGCHSAHDAKHGKLVHDEVAEVCYTCHKTALFEGKVKHKPVAEGDCVDCHAMHATDHPALLSDSITESCVACHGRIKKRPHAASGLNNKGHPVGGEKSGLQDPAQPTKPFYCGSCHDPHKSGQRWLIRYDLNSPTGFCQKCHRI